MTRPKIEERRQAILTLLESRGYRHSEIRRITGWPSSSLSYVLTEMECSGLIHQANDGRGCMEYRFGPGAAGNDRGRDFYVQQELTERGTRRISFGDAYPNNRALYTHTKKATSFAPLARGDV
jgi:hypothetical protein